MKKRDGDIASLFQRIATKKNSSSSLITSIDAIDHDGDIGPSVRTTRDSRISGGGDIGPSVRTTNDSTISEGGDIVPSVNLIVDLRTSEKMWAAVAHLLHL
jgi:hypothetical protein